MAVAVNLKPQSFDCDTCTERYCDSSNPAPFPVWELPEVGPMTVCPKPAVTATSRRYLHLYRFYQNQILAFPGSVTEQPEPYLQAMTLIDNLIYQHRTNHEQ